MSNLQDFIGGGTGGMDKSVYDPTNIEADAFDLANFFGTYDDILDVFTTSGRQLQLRTGNGDSSDRVEFHTVSNSGQYDASTEDVSVALNLSNDSIGADDRFRVYATGNTSGIILPATSGEARIRTEQGGVFDGNIIVIEGDTTVEADLRVSSTLQMEDSSGLGHTAIDTNQSDEIRLGNPIGGFAGVRLQGDDNSSNDTEIVLDSLNIDVDIAGGSVTFTDTSVPHTLFTLNNTNAAFETDLNVYNSNNNVATSITPDQGIAVGVGTSQPGAGGLNAATLQENGSPAYTNNRVTVSTSQPSGGANDKDLWLVVS